MLFIDHRLPSIFKSNIIKLIIQHLIIFFNSFCKIYFIISEKSIINLLAAALMVTISSAEYLS